jgi:serine/threonine protein kinase/Leucine-rich repeat (LRR) protein
MLIPETEIIVTKDGAEISRKTVRPGDYVIGRDPGCEVHLDVELVSRRHARLTVSFDHALIEDLGSSNGTFVNGQPVTGPTRLWQNQRIQVGAATIELHRLKVVPLPDITLAPQTVAMQRLLPEEFLRERKYDIGKVVARGGMGAILDAREAAIERRVAMKVMLDASSPDDLIRFVAEARITGQLEHPNIVPVHELSVDESGQPFYTMKMVRGITLRKVLELISEGVPETVKKYSLPALLTIFQKVCDAMAFAHSKGIIHRDLKPENIMLDDFGVVLVMDWGLAKVLTQKDAPARDVTRSAAHALLSEPSGATLAGTIMGTPQYMSPEQARGEIETLDVRSDIYALGAILYHILALRPPVKGHTAMEVVSKVAEGHIEPLCASKHRNLPDSLVAVVRKAMAFERDQRYRSVFGLQRDIEAYQTGFATSAENAGLGKQIVLLVKRHKALFGIGLAAWLVITTLAVWFIVKITASERRALETLAELRGTAPTFAAQATALVDAGNLEEALAKLGYAIRLDPKNLAYQLQRAHLLEASLHLADAVTAYQEVLALDPTNRSAHDNLLLCERLQSENDGSPHLRRELQAQLVVALMSQGRAVEAGPLAAQLGQGADAIEATLRTRLKEYSAQPDWSNRRLQRLSNGTFLVGLGGMKLGDLSILRGMPISDLRLDGCDIEDLTPLAGVFAGLPLMSLYLGKTRVTNLSPLRGVKLENLDCLGCRITDLEPLRGMPLRKLDLASTLVTDLAALASMPLQDLQLRGLTIKSLAPLRKLPLRSVDLTSALGDTDMTNFAECRELEEVSLSKFAANIEALRSLPKLARLRLEGYQDTLIPVEQFWARFKPEMEAEGTIRLALRKAGISYGGSVYTARLPDDSIEVSLVSSPVTNLDFLHGLPVSRLHIERTQVHDLTPLRGLPLKYLNAAYTTLTDIEPLRALPLTNIYLNFTEVPSVAPLQDCPTLEAIGAPSAARDIDLLRHLPKLRLLSYSQDLQGRPAKTAEQFWKEYDAQQKPAGK